MLYHVRHNSGEVVCGVVLLLYHYVQNEWLCCVVCYAMKPKPLKVLCFCVITFQAKKAESSIIVSRES